MPGFDGTGPRGLGPLTGGGRGLCLPGILPAPVQPVSTPWIRPIYRSFGGGRGRGMRGGRGFGRGRSRGFY